MTKVEFLKAVVETTTIDEIREKAQELLDQNAEGRAKAAERNAEKNAEKNAPIKDAIVAVLTDIPTITSEIAKKVEISTSKASAMLRQLVKEGRANVTDVLTEGGARKAYTVA